MDGGASMPVEISKPIKLRIRILRRLRRFGVAAKRGGGEID
jgi:hypothetical protein